MWWRGRVRAGKMNENILMNKEYYCVICGERFTSSVFEVFCGEHCQRAIQADLREAAALISQRLESLVPQCLNILGFSDIEGYMENREMNKGVYFITMNTGGECPVKIGYSSDIDKRLSALQTASPYTCEIVGKLAGDFSLEREIHSKFRQYNMRGEWFRPVDEIFIYLRDMQLNN